MKFKSSSQKQAHKKKNRCQKKVQNLHYLLSQEDKVLAIMPDQSVLELKGPGETFSFGKCFKQRNFCQLPNGRIFFHMDFSADCCMIHPDVEKLAYSVDSVSQITSRPLESCIKGECLSTDNKIIFLIGGSDHRWEKVSLSDVHVYSIRENSWVKGPSLKKPRTHASACCLNGFIYTFFGKSKPRNSSDPADLLNSIERLDYSSNEGWVTMPTS